MYTLVHLFTSGSVLFILFYVVLNRLKVNKLANFWFSIFFMAVFGAFFEVSIRLLKIYEYPHLFRIGDLLTFVLAPALFLTVKYYTIPANKISKTDYLHFVPTLIYFCINLSFITLSQSEKLRVILSDSRPNKLLFQVFEYIFIVQCIVYYLLILLRLKKYQQEIHLLEANEAKSLSWLMNFILGTMILFLLWLFARKEIPQIYISLGNMICIYYLGYYIINQKEIYPYSDEEKIELLTFQQPNDFDTIKKKFSVDNLEGKRKDLEELMTQQKPYLDNELNLVKLSKLSKMSIKELSYVINEGFNENFNQFVNRYRVEESKKILLDSKLKHLNMVGIAFEAGFSSKTVFNTTFKKITGKTPSEFIENEKKMS